MIHQTLAPRRSNTYAGQHHHGNSNSNNSNINRNNSNLSRRMTPATVGSVNRVHWRQQQKLHGSCNDLELTDDTTHLQQQQPSWRRHNNNASDWPQRPLSSGADSNSYNTSNIKNYNYSEKLTPATLHRSVCDIPNCGKLLWIRRSFDYEAAAPMLPPPPPETSTVARDLSYHIVGLPHTPLPDQRQSYLANRHAIGASMPLLRWQQQQLQQQQQQNQRQQQQQQQRLSGS